MYIPRVFDEPDIAVMHELIRACPLATLVTLTAAGIEANHIPLLLLEQAAPRGMLCGHVARSNPLWREHTESAEVLAIFHGPQNYVTPSWYATKAESGKVVPTWNYASVHARGKLTVRDDAQWLRPHLEMLTAHNEKSFEHPWAVEDAPREFTDKLIEAIVGIEIVITDLKGKWKVSQNRPPADRVSVVDGLRTHGHAEMAELVQTRAGSRDVS